MLGFDLIGRCIKASRSLGYGTSCRGMSALHLSAVMRVAGIDPEVRHRLAYACGSDAGGYVAPQVR